MKGLLPLLLLVCTNALAQKLVTNKTDEFTGKSTKETSVEALARPFKMSGFSYSFSIRKSNENTYLNLRVMSLSNKVFAVKDGQVLMFKLDNDSVVALSNSEYKISERGGAGSGLSSGSVNGVSLYFPLSKDDIHALRERKIIKLRIYTTDGYSEQEIKEVADKKVKEAFKLILD